jgi:hypothetical protein
VSGELRLRAHGARRFLLVLLAFGLAPVFVGSATAVPQQKAAVAARPVNQWPDEQFERWVFNQYGSADAARQRFESILTLQIDDIDRACHLSAEQKKKLQLIGHGDIKRIFDGYEKAKQRFKALNNDVQKLNEVMNEIRPLQMNGGPFEAESLFAKSLRHTLTGEQIPKFDVAAKERRAFRHRAQIELAVDLLEQTMPLRDAQRQDFIALLLKETKPTRYSGYYDFYLMMYQLDRIPQDKLKPLFSAMQWKVLERQIGQYKGIVPNLRQNGYLTDDDEEVEAAPASPKK